MYFIYLGISISYKQGVVKHTSCVITYCILECSQSRDTARYTPLQGRLIESIYITWVYWFASTKYDHEGKHNL